MQSASPDVPSMVEVQAFLMASHIKAQPFEHKMQNTKLSKTWDIFLLPFDIPHPTLTSSNAIEGMLVSAPTTGRNEHSCDLMTVYVSPYYGL